MRENRITADAAEAGHGRLLPVLATTTLIQITATFCVMAIAPIAPNVARSFGVGPHMIGFQISLIYLFGALGSAVTGRLVHRHGPVRVEQLALLLFAVALPGLASANLWIAALASALIGIGYGVQNPASSQILNQVTPPHRRNFIFSIKQSGMPLGVVVANLSLPTLDHVVGWQASFMGWAAVPLLLCVLLSLQKLHDVPGERTRTTHWLHELLADQKIVWRKPFRSMTIITLLYSSVQMSVSTFIVIALVEDRGWTLIAAAGTAALLQFSGAIGRVAWGMVSDRCGNGMAVLALIGAGCSLAMVGLAWISTLPEPLLLAMLCLLGATSSGWNGVAMAEMARLCPPDAAGRTIGAIMVYTFVGVVVGPACLAALYGHVGSYGLCLAAFGAASALGCGLATLAAVRRTAQVSTN